tara:strand:+ start:2125 stop:3546 length:1422 start_codon:yes stop_codon:yes gene_type:complete
MDQKNTYKLTTEKISEFLNFLSKKENKTKILLVTTGGGGQALSWILSQPGASNYLLDAKIPYSKQASREILSASDSKELSYCSEAVAIKMAKFAYQRALKLYSLEKKSLTCLGTTKIIGVGACASLVSQKEKKGDHRGFVSICCDDNFLTFSLELNKRRKIRRTRQEEDKIFSLLILHAIGEKVNYPSKINLIEEHLEINKNIKFSDKLERKIEKHFTLEENLQRLSNGDIKTLLILGKKGAEAKIESYQTLEDFNLPPALKSLIFPGSFNPKHKGHHLLAQKAQQEYVQKEGLPHYPDIFFELCLSNADKKEDLSLEETKKRIDQILHDSFQNDQIPKGVLVTRAPLFIEKARLYPSAAFILGVDTLKRLVEPHFYQKSKDDKASMFDIMTILKEFHQHKCRLIVGGRVDNESKIFQQASDLVEKTTTSFSEKETVSSLLAKLIIPLSESNFRMDISSTEIRKKFLQQKKKI